MAAARVLHKLVNWLIITNGGELLELPISTNSVPRAIKTMIKTIILYFYELNYNEHHIASFISKVVHDLFSFRREVLANGPRLCQVRFGYFLLNLL